ncbi:MAG: ATP-binding protein [Planctomycetota bacterium]|jgi:serine/threonine-protein kinase RsbW|nr:ATP-binding protein [Planctomycetota bacterium]
MPNRIDSAGEGDCFRASLAFAAPEAAPADVARLNEGFAAFLEERGAASEEANALQIALEELLTNLAKFGAAPGTTVSVNLEARLESGKISLAVSDDGVPFDPSALPPPPLEADPMQRPVGGLGVFMLRRMFDDLSYSRENGLNRSVWTLRRGKH